MFSNNYHLNDPNSTNTNQVLGNNSKSIILEVIFTIHQALQISGHNSMLIRVYRVLMLFFFRNTLVKSKSVDHHPRVTQKLVLILNFEI